MAAKKRQAAKDRLALSLGAEIDAIYALELRKGELAAAVAALDRQIDARTEKLMETFRKDELTGAQGKRGKTVYRERTVGTMKDWDAFIGHVVKRRQFELLTHGVRQEAFRELHESGKKVPGVEPFVKRSLSVVARRGGTAKEGG